MFAIKDIETFKQTDADRQEDLRGLVRTGRRILYRCWRDSFNINRRRIFCQNSGGCGSTYIIRLLEANGLTRVFHEKTPDLQKLGLEYYEQELPWVRTVSLLRYTRHDIEFEANNRLFSLSRPIHDAFPGAQFIHLHRDGTEAIRSSLSRPNATQYIDQNILFQGSLAGDHELDTFSRICHYWSNVNKRIYDDLQYLHLAKGVDSPMLRFEDLIDGNLEPLESVLKTELEIKSCAIANKNDIPESNKFPTYSNWTTKQKQTFDRICGPTMGLLGR